MTNRTMQTVVCSSLSSVVPDFDAPEPAESFGVDHNEESLEGASRQGWRRVASFIHLPVIGARGSTHQMTPVNSAVLDAALERDRNR